MTLWLVHEWAHIQTNNPFSPITLPIPWRQKPKQRQLGTTRINHVIVPHASLCNLSNYWLAAMSRVSHSCEVFAAKSCISQTKKSLNHYTYTNLDLLQTIMHYGVHIHWYVVFACSYVYGVHLFNCMLTQMANQPFRWQQLNAYRDVDMVKTVC